MNILYLKEWFPITKHNTEPQTRIKHYKYVTEKVRFNLKDLGMGEGISSVTFDKYIGLDSIIIKPLGTFLLGNTYTETVKKVRRFTLSYP